VLALTAGVFKDQREAALASGMNDFIAKPLDVEQLIATLLRYLPDCVLPLT
jgi:CheY-like chemotaxis protein